MESGRGKTRMNAQGDSNLPDDLMHKILSLVGIKLAVQTSALSSRWRYLWTSLPCLNFSSEDFKTLPKFSRFVTHVLSCRNNQIEISSAKFSFRGKASQAFVKKILNYAFSHNVKQLTISCLSSSEFPLSLFSSQSLKHLTSLTTLHLEYIKFNNEVIAKDTGLHLISAPELVSLRFKDYSYEPNKPDAHTIVDLLQQLHSVKYLTLNLEIFQNRYFLESRAHDYGPVPFDFFTIGIISIGALMISSLQLEFRPLFYYANLKKELNQLDAVLTKPNISSKGSILVNGCPTNEFQFYKGLKQGDPLSPFLFILVMESLHLSFQRIVNAGMFKGIVLDQSLCLSHMFYADDAIFLGEWSDGNISTLIHVLKCFFHASGLKINLNKSKIMGINVESAQVIQAAAKLGCLVLKCPFYYLGTRVGGSMTRVQAWQEIVETSEVSAFQMEIQNFYLLVVV
ncbi:RNA-directed DNA polymerase, eukaryota, reverse transcriptase zinc-binding domain protein [Tanacetum coccineum]